MAKKAAAKKPDADGALFQITFKHRSPTKNTERFEEEVEPGRGEKGWQETLYLFQTLPNASVVTATYFSADEKAKSDLKAEQPVVVFKKTGDTKNKVRYDEILEKGTARGAIGSVYLRQDAFDESYPEYLMVVLEG